MKTNKTGKTAITVSIGALLTSLGIIFSAGLDPSVIGEQVPGLVAAATAIVAALKETKE